LSNKNKKTTEQYKLELEEHNKVNNTKIKLKEGIEYINANTKIMHYCSCGKEWLVAPASILSGGSKTCGLCYTFAEWGIDNLGENFLEEYWDYKKNNELGINPWKIGTGSERKIYIFCKKVDYHGSYPTIPLRFTKGVRCPYCANILVHPNDSFGQFLIDSFGINALDLYWDYNKNKDDPFKIAKHSGKNVWIKCQEKDYHESYLIKCSQFVRGNRCSYCHPRKNKVHILDSLGYLYPEISNIWSNKNKKSPYKYSPNSGAKVWFKCLKGRHNDYLRVIGVAKRYGFRCPECSKESLESIMATVLKQVLKHEYPETEWEYDAGFKTDKNYTSRYDIYVPFFNLLIECQSVYHDDEESNIRDKLKKQFAIDNNYNYIELDCREYSPLEAIQMFFPYIKEIPEYVEFDKNTLRDWDSKTAQKLLNNGCKYTEVADVVGTTYNAVCHAITRGVLIKPENYVRQGIPVVCLTKDNKFVKIYDSSDVAAKELGKSNGSSISSCLTKTPDKKGKVKETAYGYKWVYLVDYENMIKCTKDNT
jgi:hypothetical protein